MDDAKIRKALERRAYWILHRIAPNWISAKDEFEFYLAGGALAGGEINDVDLFPVDNIQPTLPDATTISDTPNATTFDCKPWPVQVCHFYKPSLQELVESFDYSHIQVGALAGFRKDGTPYVGEIFYTDSFVESRTLGTTWFTGSDFPLSSLIRLGKYKQRGVLSRGQYVRGVIDCLVAIVKRGFKDYGDFKEQLDAVDLALLPEELEQVEDGQLKQLYNLLGPKDDKRFQQ